MSTISLFLFAYVMFAWLAVVFFVGLLMVMANKSLAGDDAAACKVEYRYLPRDLDAFIRSEPRLAACDSGACIGAGTFQRPAGPGEFESMFADADTIRGGGR